MATNFLSAGKHGTSTVGVVGCKGMIGLEGVKRMVLSIFTEQASLPYVESDDSSSHSLSFPPPGEFPTGIQGFKVPEEMLFSLLCQPQ